MSDRFLFVIIMIVVVTLAGCGEIGSPDTTPYTPEETNEYVPSPMTESTDRTSENVPSSTTEPMDRASEDVLSPTTESTDTVSEDMPSPTTEFDPPQPEGCTITGTDDDDVIHGTSGDDIICGLDWDDEIYGGGGDDVIYGGVGVDTIYGGEGDDVIYGGKHGPHPDGLYRESDQIYGGPGDDKVLGGTGVNQLYGEQGNDMIAAGPDQIMDEIDGGPGDDVLFPGVGITTSTTGGTGSDIAVMLDGAPDAWAAGEEASSVPVPVSVIKELPVGVSIPLEPTDPSKLVSASVLKGHLNIGTGGDVCICDPTDQTL